MSKQNEKISGKKDLLWIYGQVIALVYLLNNNSFQNKSVIWLTWEWWNWKSTMMNLIRNLIEKKYEKSYKTISINPWEYNEEVDFFDILLKEFWQKISFKDKMIKYVNYIYIFKNIFWTFYILLLIWWILFVVLYIIYNLFFYWQTLNWMLEILKNIIFLISPFFIYLSYIYIKTDFSFLNQYLNKEKQLISFSEYLKKIYSFDCFW